MNPRVYASVCLGIVVLGVGYVFGRGPERASAFGSPIATPTVQPPETNTPTVQPPLTEIPTVTPTPERALPYQEFLPMLAKMNG